jgi:kynurenine 3-monooxygenase
MVPFYGQGMNAGLEDVRVLFSFLDKHKATDSGDSEQVAYQRGLALSEYSENRKVDAHVINDLALENYTEMRASVVSPVYKIRKWMEESLSVYLPSVGWATKYSRVSFENERYSEIVKRSDRQGRLLIMGFVGAVTGHILLGGFLAWRLRKNLSRS